MRRYMYDFIQLLAPQFDRRIIDRAHRAGSPQEVAGLVAEIPLPER